MGVGGLHVKAKTKFGNGYYCITVVARADGVGGGKGGGGEGSTGCSDHVMTF